MKPPKSLTNLYEDLRDRRLLPVVGLLVVATAALPVLLGSGSDEAPAPPDFAESVPAGEEVPTDPAVLVSDPGLRDYRERLNSLRSKNPFGGQYEDPNMAESAVAEVEIGSGGGGGGTTSIAIGDSSGTAVGIAGGGTSTASDASVGTPSEVAPATSDTTSTSSEPSSGGGSSSGGSGGGPSSQWFTYRIDVVTGPAGDVEERKNIKRLTVLPSQSNPVALFVGASEGGKRATFLVSTDVVRSHGDGNCVPNPSDCQVLSLTPGEERRFEYAPRGEADTFVIHLKDIRVVAIDRPKGSGSDNAPKSANAGLKSFLGL